MPQRRSRISILRAGLLVTALALSANGCTIHHHRVGVGPNGVGSESMRQYYLFFGLIQLNEVDSQRMTRDLSGYEVVTEFSFTDFLLSPLLLLTITTRTVTVNR